MSRSLAAACTLIAAGIGLAALAPPRGACDDRYRVVRGDTLSVIARRCRSSVAAIARASGIADPNLILVGQRLVIPGRGGMPSAFSPAARAARGAATAYRFERGDTLYSLARRSRVTLPALLAANPGVDPHRIEIGALVRLPGSPARPGYSRWREREPARPAAEAPSNPNDDVEDPRRGPTGM